MAKDREPPTFVDYVVTALSPALVMALVGSLAFFLLEVLYAGQYTGRLQWTLFFFVFGAVLVSRIAIAIDPARASVYGMALGGAVFLAMLRFMDYPPGSYLNVFGWLINLGLIAIVWWSAHKLTWDCTYVDEYAEDGGQGLLAELRDELTTDPASGGRQPPDDSQTSLTRGSHQGADAPRSPEQKRRPLGFWVVYFSLAALPLFGLGQSLIPPADAGRRRYAFWLMTLYVGSGMGLLLTTCLLGLRRYLRQRRLQMPVAMTGLWIGTGTALIAAFLLAGAFLPRPNAEYPLINIRPIGSTDRSASNYAMRSDKAGKGEGRPGADGKDEAARDSQRQGGKGQSGGKTSGRSGRPEGQGKGESGSQSRSGRNSEGKSESRSKTNERDSSGKTNDDRSENSRPGGESKSRQSEQRSGEEERTSERSGSSETNRFSPPSELGAVANVLKWVVLAILGLLAVAVVLWLVLRHFAGISEWARKLLEALEALWRSLFGGSAPISEEHETEVNVVARRPRPFADFRNPFADGSAAGRSPEDLVRYSFAALEAWAFERDLPRRTDETPLEFAARLGGEVPALESDVQGLTTLYARLAYARRRLPDGCRAQVEQLWQRLEAVPGQPLPTA